MKTMLENYKKVLEVGIDIDKFFAIDIKDYQISFIGWYSKNLYDELIVLGYEFTFVNRGYLDSKKDVFQISLFLKP